MAMIPTDTGVTALEMARALLGNLTNVVGASFTGDAGKSGVASADGGADDAVFLAGGEGAAQFLDIDFVPSQDALFLDILHGGRYQDVFLKAPVRGFLLGGESFLK